MSDHVDTTTSTIALSDTLSSPSCHIETDASEQSIEIMQNFAGLCVHPLHYHSFQSQNGIQTILSNSSISFRRFYENKTSSPLNKNNRCILCGEEFSTLSSRIVPHMFQRTTTDSTATKKSNEPILKCLACNALAHRSCANSTTPIIYNTKSTVDRESTKKMPLQQQTMYHISQQCTVNRLKILEPSVVVETNQDEDIDSKTVIKVHPKPRTIPDFPGNRVLVEEPPHATSPNSAVEASQNGIGLEQANKLMNSVKQNVSMTTVAGGIAGGIAGLALLGPVGAVYACCAGAGGMNALMRIDSAAESKTNSSFYHSCENNVHHMNSSFENNDQIEATTPQHEQQPQLQTSTDHPGNLSRQDPSFPMPDHGPMKTTDLSTSSLETLTTLSPKSDSANADSAIATTSIGNSSDSTTSLQYSATTMVDTTTITVSSIEATTASSPKAVAVNSAPTIGVASTSSIDAIDTAQKGVGQLQAKKLLNSVKQNVSMTAVAGGIAGGLAGMALIGPAGAVYACYLGAGGLNVLLGLEGAATLSLVAAGIATGTITGNKIHDHIDETKQRIVTMSDPYRRTVLLVRPNVVIDPIWDSICLDAVKSAPKSAYSRQQRRQNNQLHDGDIVDTNEDEIDTKDKILLLVSRILNDGTSLPGYVLRFLVESYNDRCRNRAIICASNQSIIEPNPRARRDDVHAIIKHVTATLLNIRPALGSSSRCTELTASAVESIVFGQIYDSVLEEIINETLSYDTALWRRITMLLKDHPELLEVQRLKPESKDHDAPATESTICIPLACSLAMDTLKMVHQARSVSDKLHFCVKFIDTLSSHFSKVNTDYNMREDKDIVNENLLCADTLIQMVCQHIVLVENYGNLYAQIRFLEEFASDEQLVQGYDGYALVTIQAALHVLQEPQKGDGADDWYNDIFGFQ